MSVKMNLVFLLLIALLVHQTTSTMFCQNICSAKGLDAKKCKIYCDGRTLLKSCLKGGFKKCRSHVGPKLNKRICYVQSRKTCYNAFRKITGDSGITTTTKCSKDFDCTSGNYCERDGKKYGKCIKKSKKFCKSTSDCPTTSFCDIEREESSGECRLKKNALKRNRKQRQRKNKNKKRMKRVKALKVEKIKKISKRELAIAIAKQGKKNIMEIESTATCGNEHHSIHSHHHHNTEAQATILQEASNTLSGTIPPCGITDCEDPNFRDTFTTPLLKEYTIDWIYYNCDATWNAATKIAEATAFLNEKFEGVGARFVSKLTTVACNGNNNIAKTQVLPLLEAVAGTEAQMQSKGGFHILVGNTQESYSGWAYYPYSGTKSGIAFMTQAATQAGHTTLPHELGHAFGLKHTFDGIQSTCGSCYESETNSNLKGDFCSDTSNIPKNSQCSASLTLAETCGSRTQWVNPHTNIMSYGGCRTGFSQQQIRRARCYATTKMNWLRPTNIYPTVCYGVDSKLSTVCSSHGTCASNNTCTCTGGYVGNNCDTVITCSGTSSTNAGVCSGRGECASQDNCNCNAGFYGNNCQSAHVCSGKPATDSTVCSGSGVCSGNNVCTCTTGFTGSNCENSVDDNTAFVLSNQHMQTMSKPTYLRSTAFFNYLKTGAQQQAAQDNFSITLSMPGVSGWTVSYFKSSNKSPEYLVNWLKSNKADKFANSAYKYLAFGYGDTATHRYWITGWAQNAPVDTTPAPTTQAPTTQAPTTQAPTTQAPTTQAPTTQAPTTPAPTTQAPTTQAPTTQAPTTPAPTTQAPTTPAPTTQAPTTQAPTTAAPTTPAPTTSTDPRCFYGGVYYSGTNYLTYNGLRYKCIAGPKFKQIDCRHNNVITKNGEIYLYNGRNYRCVEASFKYVGMA